MVYKITAYNQDEKPLPGAAVTFYNSQDEPIVKLVTGSAGYVVIDDEVDGELLFSGNYIRVTKDGYYPAGGMAESLYPDHFYILNAKPNILTTVLLAAGFTALAIAGFATTKKGR